jgi:glycosyltransferase involved in cell wall biosynthesis
MKVLHVDSGRDWRGGQNQVLLACTGMAARGHDIVLACRRGSPLEQRARARGVAVATIDFGGELSPRPAWQVARVVRESRPDVVQAHDPHAITACHVALRGRARRQLVATRRVDFVPRGALARWKYRAAARVVAASGAIRRILAEAGVENVRLRLVYEGVADRPAEAGGREALRALGVPDGAPVVGNIAALVDHKDHATLLRAAGLVCDRRPDVRFVIVGDGELKSSLTAQARAAGLEGHVIFAGFREDVDRLLPAFDVFCLSSHMEGLGTIILDAMAFSRPVVATAAGGIPESVVDGVTGRLVPVRDHTALAQALLDVLERPELAAAFGRAGRARFEERFSADRMVEETLVIYKELALR